MSSIKDVCSLFTIYALVVVVIHRLSCTLMLSRQSRTEQAVSPIQNRPSIDSYSHLLSNKVVQLSSVAFEDSNMIKYNDKKKKDKKKGVRKRNNK